MILAQNKRALFDYDILEKFEAGLVLKGFEVKAVKGGGVQLKGSYVTFHNGNAYVLNMHISPYKPAGAKADYHPTASRRLLLRQKQIRYLRGKSEEKGLTIIPISVYTKNRLIKLEIAVARGRKTFDKREAIKKREMIKEMSRIQKQGF